MTYSGDPSLTPDIQDRVITTFDQTEKLASEGKLQEALLGCDFILRLDPLFTPAKRLQARLGSADEAGADATDAAPAPPEVLKTVRFSTEDLQRLIAEEEPGGEPELPFETGPLAEASLGSDPEPEADGGDLAEATSFLAGARRALDSGQIEAARRLLDMAGSLDPHSPELLDLRSELERVTAGPAEGSGGDRIKQLLADGQRAFDDERFQDAIDSWSRIFLIEIDHDEASRRIQLARDLREEQDRQIEETFHQGVAATDAGKREQAAKAFRRVLELRPNHAAAREYLERLGGPLAEGEPAAGAPVGPRVESGGAPPPGVVPVDLQVAPPGAARKVDESYRMAARAKRKPVSPFFLIGAAVLVLTAVGAWFLVENWGRLFPNATEEVAPAAENRIEQATAIHDSGDLKAAIALLEKIGSDSREYLPARRLLTSWGGELASRAVPVETLSEDDAARQSQLIAGARQAYDNGNYLEAARFFTRASAMAPLAAGEAALFNDCKRLLEPIAQQIDLYTQRQWELALPTLWRRLEQAPRDKDVLQLLVNSYFNLTVRELRRGEIATAETYIEEGARLDRDDRGVTRLAQFVTTYRERPRDLLFEIFVQELDFRH